MNLLERGGAKGRRGKIQEGQARGAATVCDASARSLSIALSCPEMLALTTERKSAQKWSLPSGVRWRGSDTWNSTLTWCHRHDRWEGLLFGPATVRIYRYPCLLIIYLAFANLNPFYLIISHYFSLFLVAPPLVSKFCIIKDFKDFKPLHERSYGGKMLLKPWKTISWPTWNENGLKGVVGFAEFGCV